MICTHPSTCIYLLSGTYLKKRINVFWDDVLRLWFVLAVNYVHVQSSLLEEQRYRKIYHHQEKTARQIEMGVLF